MSWQPHPPTASDEGDLNEDEIRDALERKSKRTVGVLNERNAERYRRLAEILRDDSPDALGANANLDYCITTTLPVARVDFVEQALAGELVQNLGIRLEFGPPPSDGDDDQTRHISVIGPLVKVYTAMTMMTGRSEGVA
mmetsp:Transcript_25503/g.39886  ORF Transcript_25503/g.39886 Transcript_25503/m.39886 type:complete len:139 (+) Transcript_25503:88-504(+)